ncbi:MAG: chemotaxis protein CheD [Campylobacterota bacterium]|nr:chemotaxis protein CheD [Campylobacterota bacterium]
MDIQKSTFIHVGEIYIDTSPMSISTILGSCIAVCLYDSNLQIGGMNHYLLPFWNNNGLQSPKYGNISIPLLIEKMLNKGSKIKNLEAKIFGGAALNIAVSNGLMIGEKNISVAHEILEQYKIKITAQDVGGSNGRKILFNLDKGKVLLKYTSNSGEICGN